MRLANHKITINQISSSARTSDGGAIPTYSARHADEPVRIDWKTGIETAEDGTRRSFQEANIYMDIKTVALSDQVVYDGTTYDIISVVDMAGHGFMQRLRVRLKE